MHLAIPVLLLAFMAATALAGDISKDVGFTPAEQQNMIDLHNHYRARVARGEERNQPQAADMIAMEWDDRLMNSAQKWSSTCRGWHNKNEERRFKPYPYTGQNYAGMMGMTESVRAWYNEVTEGNFGFHGFQCSGVCGHYTQVVWGKAHLLGCAQNKCKSYGEDKGNVYCEYAPGGNTQFKMKKDPVYTVGKPCSKCPQGFSFCMSGSLCASSRACKNSDSKCECTIKSCENGGTLDKANCQCKCPAAFEGPSCETPCEDKIDFCDGYSAECAWNANMWMWMGRECRKFCKKCGGVKDPGYTNSGGIKTNAKDMSSEINCNNGANDASCAMWMDQCVSNPDYMKKECARACGFCKSQFVKVKPPPKPKNAIGHYRPSSTGAPGVCINIRDDKACEYWEKQGECDRIETQMRKFCAKACGFCDGLNQKDNKNERHLVPSRNCYDERSSRACDFWKKKGECEHAVHHMRRYCAKTCNLCDEKPQGDDAKPGSGINSACRNARDDRYCRYWSDRNACSNNRDLMLKECQRTCGFCGVNDGQGQTCKNYLDNGACDKWYQGGLCKKLPHTMEIYCKKTCDMCHKSAKPAAEYSNLSTCRNELGDTICERYKATGECLRMRHKMNKFCQKSCGVCLLGQKALLEDKGCLNSRGDIYCNYWSRKGRCGRDEVMRLDCKKACGFCTNEITDSDQYCEDRQSAIVCNTWVQSKMCNMNMDFMKRHCRRSCQFCDTKPPTQPSFEWIKGDTTGCFDQRGHEYCSYWAQRGQCNITPDDMRRHCRKTCDFCPGTGVLRPDPEDRATDCVDERKGRACHFWLQSGECEKRPEIMVKYCRRTCGLCGGNVVTNQGDRVTPTVIEYTPEPVTEVVTTDRDCFNDRGDDSCMTWKSQGHCKNSPELMKSYCRKECGFCRTTVTVRPTDPTPIVVRSTRISEVIEEVCINARGDESCRAWKSQGYCEKTSNLMESYCRKECSFCGTSEETTEEEMTPMKVQVTERTPTNYYEECSNERGAASCRAWKRQGHCENSRDLMESYCRKECGFCTSTATDRVETDRGTEETTSTSDREDTTCANERGDQSCRDWKAQGHCENSPQLMKSYCRLTCGYCKTGVTSNEVPTDTGTPSKVVDRSCYNEKTDENCRSWKAQGHCQNSPDLMRSYCQKECNFCGTATDVNRGTDRVETTDRTWDRTTEKYRPTVTQSTNVVTETVECVNKKDDSSCRAWASQGHCENSKDLMKSYCFKECGFCKPRRTGTERETDRERVTTQPDVNVAETVCVNAQGDASCRSWKAQGHCENSPQVMQSYCKRECGFCQSAEREREQVTRPVTVRPDIRPTGNSAECINVRGDDSCRSWKSQGHCENNADLMRNYCMLECGYCTATSNTRRPETARPETVRPETVTPEKPEPTYVTNQACTNAKDDDSCQAWKAQGHCEKSRDLMRDYCYKSCGFCTVGTTEPTRVKPETEPTRRRPDEECVNTKEDQSCRGWKSQGYCETSQDLMREYCARECRFCGEATETSRETQPGREETNPTETSGACVNSRDDASCRAWRSTGYCESQEQLMRDYCPLECGFCGGTRTTEYTREKTQRPTAETRACVNTRTIESCRSWKAQGYCESSTDLMRDYCARECGLCDERVRTTEYTRETTERPDVQTRACVNTKDTDSCRAWRAQGYCETSRDLMRQYCARECQFCEQEGDATTREPYSRESTRTTETEVGCVDTKDIESCRSWKAQGYCETSQELMQDYCASTCEFCGGRQPTRETYPRETTAETESTDCVNTREEQSCRAWKSQGYCESSVDLMRQYCARECGFCSGRQTPRETYTREPTRTISGQDCVDTKEYEACRSWKSQGYCETSQELMRDYCQRTCGFCDGRSVESTRETYNQTRIDTRPSETEECVNTKELAACRNWKSAGYCESSPELMAEYCRKECNFCGAETFENIVDKVERPTTQATSTCVNERDENSCRSWKAQGYCDTQPDLMSQYCALTCGLCGEVRRENIDRTTQETRTQPTGRACFNEKTDESCRAWKSQGYCESSAELMKEYCSRECGFCRGGYAVTEETQRVTEDNRRVTEYHRETSACRNTKEDESCRSWKQQGYCETSQELMRSYCALECGLCEAGSVTDAPRETYTYQGRADTQQPTAETHAGCVNTKDTDSCQAWKSQGYCDSSQDLMRDYCALTCGFCGEARPFQPTRETDTYETQRPEARGACINTKDLDSCQAWKSQGHCERSRDLMRDYCALECGLCDGEPQRVPETTRRTEVSTRGQTGREEVTPGVDVPVYNTQPPRACTNARDDAECRTWKSQGHCEQSPERMRGYCRKECGFCSETESEIPVESETESETVTESGAGGIDERYPTDEECTNAKDDEACRNWSDQGYCETSPELMKEYCAKECNLCSDDDGSGDMEDGEFQIVSREPVPDIFSVPIDRRPTYNGVCENQLGDYYCRTWASQGHCQTSVYLMKVYCLLECNLCETTSTRRPKVTSVEVDIQQECENAQDDVACESWASTGYCTNNKELMNKYCRKTCNFCADASIRTVLTSNQPEDTACVNRQGDTDCAAWKAQGRCESSAESMRDYCAKACGFCRGVLSGTDEPVLETSSEAVNETCVDARPQETCEYWKSEGYCSSSRDQMYDTCRKTCELCEVQPAVKPGNGQAETEPPKEKTTTAPFPDPAENELPEECFNKQDDRTCRQWREAGHCESSAGHMLLYCRRECRFCGDAEDHLIPATTAAPQRRDPKETCFDKEGEEYCTYWQSRGECIQNRAAMLVDCRKSCRFCYPNTIGIRTGIVKNGTEILPSKTDKNIDSKILSSLSKDHTATDPTEIAPTKESTVETNIESESVDSEIKVETVNTENELREDKDMTALPIPSPEEIHILDETAEIEEKLHELEDRLQEIEKQENKNVA